jgi:putative polymerase
LPFLGDHRVSSIFLEPVSPGNFAVIVLFWAIVRSKFERTLYYGLSAMAIFLTIMADNRFGAYLCAVALCFSLVPRKVLYLTAVGAPIGAIVVLLGIAFWSSDGVVDNSLSGRLLSSGRALAMFDLPNWLGIGESTSGEWDSGYAYTIGQTGIVGFAAFWGVLMALKAKSPQFDLYRSFCGLYFAAILCVSYSPYTIKTAALLWFLLGALYPMPAKGPIRQH